MKISAIYLRESLKQELLAKIDEYEKKYSIPVILTKAVLLEMINELNSVEMQELIRGVNDGERRPEDEKRGGVVDNKKG